MDELTTKADTVPANEKSCQTDDLTDEAVVPGPDHASKTWVNSTEVGDPPLLQRPLETSISGIQQIIECFRTGTVQLKHILLKEVDIIFECKVCRSLFRGLPNLITHKENYCLTRLSESDESSRESKSIKELLDAIYPRADRQKCYIRLEPIAGNQNAVFQYVSTEEDLPPPCQELNTKDLTDTIEEDYHRHIKDEVKASTEDEDQEERTEEDDPCRCLLCNRTYKIRGRLQRHLRTVHNIATSDDEPTADSKKRINDKLPESPVADGSTSSGSQSPKEENKIPWKPEYSMGFDLKTRFCKLCRRTFSTEQNLAKHIELHTDNGTDFFVKFYRCPLCRYKTRRKRDVMRHLSEFHKKTSAYLCRISESLDNSTIKTPAEDVLNKDEVKQVQQSQETNHHSYLTRRNPPPKVRHENGDARKAVKSKTREKPNGARDKVMQSMLVCDVCGQGFRKQRHLAVHMRKHQKTARGNVTGVRTRSKVVF